MKRIYDFSSFSKIYEAEETKGKPYLGLLKQILSYLNTSYMSQIKLAEDPYDSKIMGDLDLIINTPGVDSYKKILANIKSAVDTNSPEAKSASDAWSASGEKFVNALAKLIEKLPNDKDSINKIITDFLNLQKQNLQQASKENKLKESYSYESLNESLFKTKKGLLDKLAKEVTLNTALLKNYESIPGMEDSVATQKGKINGIMNKFASKGVNDMEKEELEKDLELIASIPIEISKRSEDLAKEDDANKEAAAIFVDALKSLEDATEKDKTFVEKVKVEKETEDNWNKSAKDAIGFKGTIKMEDVKGKKDKTVKSFQEEVIRSFKDVIKGSEDFKKFTDGKFAGDGYFGDNTAKIIKGLKAGFGMKDTSSDITDEFLNNVFSFKPAEKKNESISYGRFQSFSSFESLNEAKVKFDVNKFLEATGEKKAEEKKELPTTKELYNSMKKTSEDVYNNNKEAIDYIMSKDFEPNEKGKDAFKLLFRASWDKFKDYTDQQKKNTLAMGMNYSLIPAIGKDKGIDKEIIDIYLKPESSEEKK